MDRIARLKALMLEVVEITAAMAEEAEERMVSSSLTPEQASQAMTHQGIAARAVDLQEAVGRA